MVEDRGEDDKSITYTDIVGALMKSVTKIINTISYVLIAFVAISLVVSSIMIGVITYISVLERRKEIGILRAMGASKRNVADVFNAETMINDYYKAKQEGDDMTEARIMTKLLKEADPVLQAARNNPKDEKTIKEHLEGKAEAPTEPEKKIPAGAEPTELVLMPKKEWEQ